MTQLINSFLGALAHPWETYQDDLTAMSLAQARADGWPKIDKELATDREPHSLGDLIKFVRHAVAHGNLIFLPGQEGEIRAIQVINKDPNRNYKQIWGAIVTVADMRAFLERFVALAEDLHDQRNRSRPQIA